MSKKDDGFGGFDVNFGTEPSDPVDQKKGTAKVKAPAPQLPRAKKAKQQLTPKEKTLLSITRKANVPSIPKMEDILANMVGSKMAIKDIALFTGKPSDPVLAELAAECPTKNSVNLSAEVQKRRVIAVGIQILKTGRMYTPIMVAKIGGNNNYECVSGRHRLAFLALAYGTNAEVPVIVQYMTLNQARDAVVVANQSRRADVMEQAEHAVLKAVQGDVAATQEEMYIKTAENRAKLKKYCTYAVQHKNYPEALGFTVAQSQARKEGGIMLLGNIEVFFGAALDWKYGMPMKDFDVNFQEAIKFLNSLVGVFVKIPGFDPKSHTSGKTMIAIGKYFKAYKTTENKAPLHLVGQVAQAIVDMGDIGKQKSENTFKALTVAMPIGK